jgi:hypothetical protein
MYEWWQVYLCPPPFAPGVLAFLISAFGKTVMHSGLSHSTREENQIILHIFPLPCTLTSLIYTVFQKTVIPVSGRTYWFYENILRSIWFESHLGDALNFSRLVPWNTFKFQDFTLTNPCLNIVHNYLFELLPSGKWSRVFCTYAKVTKESAMYISRILNWRWKEVISTKIFLHFHKIYSVTAQEV